MKVSTPMDMAQFGTILGVWAHPDDETWSMAGIAMLALANRQRVACITATKGEQGVQNEQKWPRATLAEVRKKELEESLKILGIKEHYWLDYPDGLCNCQPNQKAIAQISEIMQKVKPDSVFSFGPDGMTGHEDHKTVSMWAVMAAEKQEKKPKVYRAVTSREWYETQGKELDKKFNIYFNIDEPPLVEEGEADIECSLTHELVQRKLDALRAQTSQTEGMFASKDLSALFENAESELFMRM